MDHTRTVDRLAARSRHSAWEPLTLPTTPLPWLAALDPAWDLMLMPELMPEADWSTSPATPTAGA